MKLWISVTAICVAAVAALGVGSARAATTKSYCIDSATATVSNATALGILKQFQLDTFVVLGGAYTAEGISFGTDADAAGEPESLVDALGDLDDIVSPFALPGGVFHPVIAGACPVVTPPPTPVTTPAETPGATPAETAAPVLPPAEEGIFLCYSKAQLDPGVWPATVAGFLLLSGEYWKPTAVLGTDSSTRLGDYSLVCNPGKSTAGVSTAAVDGAGGLVVDPDVVGRLDVYTLAG